MYAVTDEHGWHYHYPPLTAALLTPLAQPPAESKEKALVPFSTVAAGWFLVGIGCVMLSIHRLSRTVGSTGLFRDGKYQFWLVHVPLWVLLPTLGALLSRGQVNEWILVLLSGMIVLAIGRQSFLAGLCLAGAACIKVVPLFLIVYPLWKRDTKWLAGTAAGLVVGLFIIPAAIIGPKATLSSYRQWANQIVHPVLADGANGDRSRELLDLNGTDNQSIQGMLHNWRHFDRATRPALPEPSTRMAHWLIGGLMTVVTVLIGARSTLKEPHRESLAISALIVPMLLISPVTHLHYFVLLMPLVVALIGSHMSNARKVRPALMATLVCVLMIGVFVRLPGCEMLRDIGLMSIASVALWAAALIELSGEAKLKVKLPGRDYVRELKETLVPQARRQSHAAEDRASARRVIKNLNRRERREHRENRFSLCSLRSLRFNCSYFASAACAAASRATGTRNGLQLT